MLHIRNSLGTKFHVKLTILIFFDQINPKRVKKKKKKEKKMRITIEFYIFELV